MVQQSVYEIIVFRVACVGRFVLLELRNSRFGCEF